MLEAVIFDVDFTIARPGPELGPEGYRRLGARYGLTLDAGALRGGARPRARDAASGIRSSTTTRRRGTSSPQTIIEGMGGVGDTYAAAVEMTDAWSHAHHFELYDDALPTLAALRARGTRIGLLSNTSRDLATFAAHHGLDVDAVLTSRAHGKTKPHEAIFRRMLELLGVAAAGRQ